MDAQAIRDRLAQFKACRSEREIGAIETIVKQFRPAVAVAEAVERYRDHVSLDEECGCMEGDFCDTGIELFGQICDADKAWREARDAG